MQVKNATKSARMCLNTNPAAKALIKRAAALSGATVSDFVVQNAYEAASHLIARQERIALADKNRAALFGSVQNAS
jgi:uncharacterized protein (DUF1778 family)